MKSSIAERGVQKVGTVESSAGKASTVETSTCMGVQPTFFEATLLVSTHFPQWLFDLYGVVALGLGLSYTTPYTHAMVYTLCYNQS